MIFARLLKLFSSENRSGRAGQGRAAAGQGRTMGFLLLLIFLAAQCWLVQTLNESTALRLMVILLKSRRSVFQGSACRQITYGWETRSKRVLITFDRSTKSGRTKVK